MSTIISTKQSLITTKLPKATKSYSPVPHKAVINTILEELDKKGVKVLGELYSSARKGKIGMGNYQLDGGDSEMNLRLAFLNSYDKSKPLQVGFGTNVIVCTNGMFVSDMLKFKRKHTGTVLQEFKEEIGMYVDKAGEIFEKIKYDREAMKNIEMTKRTTAELIGRMYVEENIITETQIAVIKRELQNPSFNYGIENSLWNVYNAATVSMKETHPGLYMDQHSKLHKFVEKEFQLA